MRVPRPATRKRPVFEAVRPVLAGLWLAAGYLLGAILLAITLVPFGRTIVRARKRAPRRRLDDRLPALTRSLGALSPSAA